MCTLPGNKMLVTFSESSTDKSATRRDRHCLSGANTLEEAINQRDQICTNRFCKTEVEKMVF